MTKLSSRSSIRNSYAVVPLVVEGWQKPVGMQACVPLPCMTQQLVAQSEALAQIGSQSTSDVLTKTHVASGQQSPAHCCPAGVQDPPVPDPCAPLAVADAVVPAPELAVPVAVVELDELAPAVFP